MPNPHIYFDACCFIDAVKIKIGAPTLPARKKDIDYTHLCLEAALAGEITVIASTLVIAEAKRATDPPDPEAHRLFQSILCSGRVVTLVDVTKRIAQQARDLEWNYGLCFGGADAVHIATAVEFGCRELMTYDSKRSNSPMKLAAEIEAKLGLKVIYPSQTISLPSKYLTTPLPYATAAVTPAAPAPVSATAPGPVLSPIVPAETSDPKASEKTVIEKKEEAAPEVKADPKE